QYCESLRCELVGSGIRVVTLLPGYIDTPLTRKNKYKMPFLMAADDFVAEALRVIEKGEKRKVIPWQMAWVARVMYCMPDSLYDRLVQGRPRKQRRE
ncbi:MAG: short-chain dehydrogenase, partial [Hylemonella sp.]|nr:short-chain dehydrogenase [Hylemonella sp.]